MIFAGGFDSKLVWFDTSNWSEIRNESILPGWISGIDTTPDDRLCCSLLTIIFVDTGPATEPWL